MTKSPHASNNVIIRQAIDNTPRKQFVTSSNDISIVGHSIPSESIVQQILQNLELSTEYKLLHVGSGSGYLTAIVSLMVKQVITIEKNHTLAKLAKSNFSKLKLENIQIVIGDAGHEIPEQSPFNIIIISTPGIKAQQLLRQLAPGGQLIAIEGKSGHSLQLVKYSINKNKQCQRKELGIVNFSGYSGKLNIVDKEILTKAREIARKKNTPVIEQVRQLIKLEDIELYSSLAKQHNITLAKADKLLQEADPKVFSRFSRAFLDHHRLIPLSDKNHCLKVVTTDPEASTNDFRTVYPDHVIEKILVTPTGYHRLWSSLELSLDGRSIEDAPPAKVVKEVNILEREQTKFHAHLILVFEALLLDAIGENASDIHLEIYAEEVRIRIRVDGELRDLNHYRLSPTELAGLVNVIKTRCELDISEHRLPQGGRSHLRADNVVYDLRVQTQPSLYGEHVVIRLLRQDSELIKIEGLGFPPIIANKYKRLLHDPAGLILVVGPTGSGKTTTLCAGLQLLASDGTRKVITIEDPIEYSIKNIQQTRVQSAIGFNFADAMRAFVREDPDVILVGEIRDRETALEAIRASQTGHLVLSTLHSNDAVDALQRIYDLDILPNSIAGELLAVVAQRLAKKICQHCKHEATADPQLLEELFPSGPPKNFKCFEGRGCKDCDNHGTRGRVAVIEYLHANNAIRNAISAQPPVGELRSIALDAGLVTMRDSALDHVIQGTIPLSELPRILPAERMAPEVRGGVNQS